jgi:homoserine kinase
VIVRVPASSANLGPGFDVLGMALALHARAGIVGDWLARDGLPDGAQVVDEHHPASIAFRRAGGRGGLWISSPIPMGRGLGFSGAVRVAGAALAGLQRSGAIDRDEVLELTSALEGHADNAAASIYGGVIAVSGGSVVPIPLALDPAIVVWIPSAVTATDASRRALPGSVPLDDAVFNLGRVALLVGALAAGDIEALRPAAEDRLHQDRRFDLAPASRRAFDVMLEHGAWCAWLSGSGPAVAAMCAVPKAEVLAATLPTDGHTKVLRIDHAGVVVEAGNGSPS